MFSENMLLLKTIVKVIVKIKLFRFHGAEWLLSAGHICYAASGGIQDRGHSFYQYGPTWAGE